MDRASIWSNSRNTTKTDLSLLLECVKFQMKCPDLQKQALLTIHSICEKKEDNVDLLRELGGVAFLYNLSKSSIVHSDVKEAALFTLGTLAEANVYCKNSLCRKETFTDIAGLLMKEDSPLNQKRVSVYLLFVLVANNKLGQTLAQTTGCLEILMDLFRTTFPFPTVDNLRTVSQTYQLWASVSGALCGSVNNPQNEEGQRVCVAAFPIVKTWLQQISVPSTETFQPICSFIAMTASNNSYVQESFAACGGLETLTLVLLRVVSAADTSLLSCQLSVVIVKTLSACITDNPTLASGMAQYGLVSHLFSLLTSSHLDPDDRLSVLLTIGECTEASEEHQSQLVGCGGLPLMITFLTEDSSEEVKKAATFILQTCKKATLGLGVQGLGEKEVDNINVEEFKSSAREMLRRIELLEKRQLKEIEEEQEDVICPYSAELQCLPSKSPPLPPQKQEGSKTTCTLRPMQKSSDSSGNLQPVQSMAEIKNIHEKKTVTSSLNPRGRETKMRGGDVMCPIDRRGGILMSSDVLSLERGSESHTARNSLFTRPLSVWPTKPKEITCSDKSQDSDLNTMRKIPAEEHLVSNGRCAGCVLTFEEVTSRTFASVQSSCGNSCDMHRVLQEATERFRMGRFNLEVRQEQKSVAFEHADASSAKVSTGKLQKRCENVCAGNDKSSLQQHFWRKHNGFTLTPLYKTTSKGTCTSKNRTGPSLTPLKRPHLPEASYKTSDSERRGRSNSEHYTVMDQSEINTEHCSSRRKRQDFSREEIHYLLSGVEKYGYSWNSILWSYPFQPGRTNVDLAKKYRRLMGK